MSASNDFATQVHRALHDEQLQGALRNCRDGFTGKRKQAVDALPEFEALRQSARAIKDHTLAHLADYLEQFERQVQAAGGQVHWAESAAEAREIIVGLCREAGARNVLKGKSMVGEEIGLNQALQEAEVEPVETDLGEYIIQLADEPPSHIIAPAIHKRKDEIAELFRRHHPQFDTPLNTAADIVAEARTVLRKPFTTTSVGITGANFLVAESGSIVLVTNEGNGDLTATLPDTHIVLAGIEKVVPTLEQASVLLRLLARSATGQETTAYTTFFTGPRRKDDVDGPESFHIVLLDNGRSDMLGGRYREMLRCIRCGACLNHCPVYGAIGGHAYGWVYPGPMGSVLTPLMQGMGAAKDLPNASTLCGRCEEVCPMSIPLPDLLRQLREDQRAGHLDAPSARGALRLWGFVARHPRLYRFISRLAAGGLAWLGGKRGRIHRLPLASAWTRSRDLPAPGRTFMAQWQKQNRSHRR